MAIRSIRPSKEPRILFSQSSILDLYDPDRAKSFRNGTVTDAAAFEKALDGLLKNAGDGAGLAFLLEANNSPTRERLRLEIEKKYPERHVGGL